MTINEYVRAVGKKVGPMGGAYMMSPVPGEDGGKIGLDFLGFYALGRGGVLGDVDGSAVAEAFYFFEPNLVAATWNTAKEKVAPAEAAQAYIDSIANWGRERFSGVADVEEFTKLADRVIAAHDPTPSSSLYAGWREAKLPDDAPAKAAVQIVMVLREMRGGAHIDAVKKVGVGPKVALATNSPHMYALFGYTDEMPATDANACEEAEEITDGLVAPAFETLSDSERETFQRVLNEIASIAGV